MAPKYIFVNGVMKLNPAYQAEKAANKEATTIAAPDKALAVVSSTNDIAAASEVMEKQGREMPLAESTTDSMAIIQEPDFTKEFTTKTPIDGGELLDKLSNAFAQYEVPIGLVNKLLALIQYKLNFIIDDSGSMSGETDSILDDSSPHLKQKYNPNNDRKLGLGKITRWQEVEDRLYIMMQIISYIPIKGITIGFLNRSEKIEFGPQETPEAFFEAAKAKISEAFKKGPSGLTPIHGKLTEAFAHASGPTMHYLFSDGVPSDKSVDEIASLVIGRCRRSENPLTFISCSDKDEEVAWMKKIDENADFTAEVDDFADEKAEVLNDQGPGFPYSKGFWILCMLVGAINPDDLDAIDEDYPFTRMTLNNLMGRKLTVEEYSLYFNQNPHAQKEYKDLFNEFLREDIMAKDIERVKVNIAKNKAYIPGLVGHLGHATAASGSTYVPQLTRP